MLCILIESPLNVSHKDLNLLKIEILVEWFMCMDQNLLLTLPFKLMSSGVVVSFVQPLLQDIKMHFIQLILKQNLGTSLDLWFVT